MSKEEEILNEALLKEGFPFEREYQFHPYRRWKVDFAFTHPDVRLVVEVEGRGRHQSTGGFVKDCEKYNALTEAGWKLLRFPASSIRNKTRLPLIVDQIKRIVCSVEDNFQSASVLTGE